jgi:hypothetical protein
MPPQSKGAQGTQSGFSDLGGFRGSSLERFSRQIKSSFLFVFLKE